MPEIRPQIRLSIVIPAWNEANRIGTSLQSAIPVLHELVPAHEILVIDDGSQDNTLEVAAAAAKEAFCFRGIRNEQNLGKGGAVRRGMLEASGEYVLFCDADESTPMSSLKDFLPKMDNQLAVIIGTRKNPDALIKRHQPWLRETMGKAFTTLAHQLAGVRVTDFTCGFKIFRQDAAKEVFSRQTITDWSFDAEILFLANHLGYSIDEVPVTWTNDVDTRVRLLRDTWDSLLGLLNIRLGKMTGRYGPAQKK
jgi:dolichyl-phosphate beta-glucosyltransferase